MAIHSSARLCCIISLALTAGINAQNLVLNPDFEEVEVKPYYWPKISITKAWSNGNGGTADFFNKRACKYENGIPENYMGEQLPYNGDRYAGIIAFYDDGPSAKAPAKVHAAAQTAPASSTTSTQPAAVINQEAVNGKYAEYLQTSLSAPLIAGSTYAVSFRVSLADKSAHAVAGLGACLTSQPSSVKTNSYSLLTPQIVSAAIIEDKNSWVEISGAYVAKGDEKYLLIGAFKPALKSKKIIPEYTNDTKKAYYYIDAVSVTLAVVKPEIKEEPKPAIDFSEELSEGKSFVFKNLKFETGKSVLLPESYTDLDILVNWLKENKTVKVIIGCHTDRSGSDVVNQKLSDERAGAVKKYIVSKAIEPDRVKAKGYGSTKLLDKNNVTAKENRRVEVAIVK